ncbi:MAG: sulfite exporter TauE/SafE family protein [Pseudolabrys sp.]|nr:sulfite exporter TauE/SafE family protein [Pseudolabrys sp.]
MDYILVLVIGLIAGTIGGVIGTGTSIMLVPVLVYAFGPKEAIPIMAVAAVLANAGRMVVWWRQTDWRACAVYSLTSIPAAALGARTLLALPSRVIDICIAVFMLLMIPIRHWLAARGLTLKLWHLAIFGAVLGYLTGIVASTGPASVPVFLAYGLTKGALLGTEATSSLAVYISKTITFQQLGALPWSVALNGVIAGSTLIAGAFIAKPFVLRFDPNTFRYVIDGLMLLAGLAMLWAALTT